MPSSTPYFKMGKPSPREVSRSAGVQSWKGSAQAPGRSDSVSAPAPVPKGCQGRGCEGCTRPEKDPQMTAGWRTVRLSYSCGLHLVLLRLFFLIG